jgi:ubiquinone/menaquinone biosynthesis C-methylase UbiE
VTEVTEIETVRVARDDWLRRWDAQQEVYTQDRERCFDVMLSFLAVLMPESFTVLDLAAGPGAISQRLLARFPQARSVAVDADPVMLQLGHAALGDRDGRLRWVQADFRDLGWPRSLGEERFDAVLSSTATHWLRPHELTSLYHQVFGVLRAGGVLLNGDGLPLPASQRRTRGAIAAVDERRQAQALGAGAESWTDWWESLGDEPSVQAALTERKHIFPSGSCSDHGTSPTLPFHEAAILAAGFEEVATVWQDLNKRLLLALR